MSGFLIAIPTKGIDQNEAGFPRGRVFERAPLWNVPDSVSSAHVVSVVASYLLLFFLPTADMLAWFVVVPTIVVATVFTRVAKRELDTAFASAEIAALKKGGDGLRLGYLSHIFTIAVLVLIICALLGLLVWSSKTWLLWPAAIGIVAAEAIYLAWLFEGVATKQELEAIACELSSNTSGPGQGEDSPATSEASRNREQVLRVRASTLIDRLQPLGFAVRADVEVHGIYPASHKAGEGFALTINGDRLDLIKEVKLVPGSGQVVATDVVSNASSVSCNVTLPRDALGAWDVIVADGLGRTVKLASALTITPP